MTEKKLNLHQRIIAIMDDMGAVGKSGKTTYGESYAYHKIDDVDDRLRKALIAHGVVATIIEIADRKVEHFEEKDKRGNPRTTWYAECAILIELVNADSPDETMTIQGWGQGIDYSDKATGKAISYAAKAAYLSAFHLRGQPDNESDNIQRRAAEAGRQKVKPLTGHDVHKLQEAIQEVPTTQDLTQILRGPVYAQLKAQGPADVYAQTKKLAEARHALLTSAPDEDSP